MEGQLQLVLICMHQQICYTIDTLLLLLLYFAQDCIPKQGYKTYSSMEVMMMYLCPFTFSLAKLLR